MADFNNLALTSRGLKALLDAQAGAALTLSKIGMGSGSTTSGISALTNMVTPELILPISEKKMSNDSGHLTIIAKMTNESMTEGFYWRETGLFFEDANGNDVLFAYACITDDQYDYVPAYSDKRYAKHIRIANIVTDAANITIKEGEGLLYVDVLTFEEFKEEVVFKSDPVLENVLWTGNGTENEYGFVASNSKQAQFGVTVSKKDTKNSRAISIKNGAGSADIAGAFEIQDVKDGVLKSYRLYGEHNKPKAQDVETLKIYRSFSALNTELGTAFSSASAINDIIAAMPDNTGLVADIAASSIDIYPVHYGILEIYKIRANRVKLEFVSNDSVDSPKYGYRWIGQSTGGVFSGWDRVYTEDNPPTANDVGAIERGSSHLGELGYDPEIEFYIIIDGTRYKIPFGYGRYDAPFLPLIGGRLTGPTLQLGDGCGSISSYSLWTDIGARKNSGEIDKNQRGIRIRTHSDTVHDYQSLQYRCMVEGVQTMYNIFGEHNKPSGSYTGNGSATERIINVGGIGNYLFMYSAYGFALATPRGIIVSNDTGIVRLKESEGRFASGVLTLATTNTIINSNGVSVAYEVV